MPVILSTREAPYELQDGVICSSNDLELGVVEWECKFQLNKFLTTAGGESTVGQIGVMFSAVVAAGAEVFHKGHGRPPPR